MVARRLLSLVEINAVVAMVQPTLNEGLWVVFANSFFLILGAENEEIKCCNTCEDVREAYRRKGWAFSSPDSIAQVCATTCYAANA